MHLSTVTQAALRVAGALLVCSMALAQSSTSAPQSTEAGTQGAARFDGKWMTKMTCPPKGSTEGYTWFLPTVIEKGQFHAERGTAGEPGFLGINGKIAADGSAKLSADGIVASRQYARGVLAHKGEDYSYDIKAHFEDSKGEGTRDVGLGIVGRPCTFEFFKK